MAGQMEKKKKGEEEQLVVFRLEGEEYGVGIHQVREIIRNTNITHIPETSEYMEGVINLRGEVVAVVDLGRQFGLARGEVTKDTRIIIVEYGDTNVGMRVDAVPQVLRISKDEIEPVPEVIETKVKRNYLRGVGKIGDRLIILLDLEKVLSEQQVQEARSLAPAERGD